MSFYDEPLNVNVEGMLKFDATTPRVVRSPIPERDQVIVMDGSTFEDGKQRIVVNNAISEDHVNVMIALLDAKDIVQEQLDQKISAIRELLLNES